MGPLLKGASGPRARLAATAFAVALAVSLVSGTLVLTDTIDSALHRAAAPTEATSDVVVRATARFTAEANSLPEREAVPDSLLVRIEGVPGVRAVWGAIQGYAALIDARGRAIASKGLPTVGKGWAPGDTLEAGRPPGGPGEVAIDATTAGRHGLRLGDRVQVVVAGGARQFTVEGLLGRAGGPPASTNVIFDPATAQRVLGQLGHLDAISVEAAPGLSPMALRARINATLPERYEAVTGTQVAKEAEQSWTKAVRFLPTALSLFAAAALLVGAFVIFNTFSILVAQRARELGLLRAVGASRAQLTVAVLAEAMAVGLAASFAGVLLGLGAARALLALFAGMGYGLPDAAIALRPRTVVAGLASGVLVTTLAAVVPVRRATGASPVGATSGVGSEGGGPLGRRAALGGAALLAGVAVVLAPPSGGSGSRIPALGVGAAGILVGLAVVTPLVARRSARVLGAPLVRLLGQPGLLGRENAMRNPRRTAATASALTIGVGLVGVVAILAASMSTSAAATVAKTLRADFVVVPDGPAGGVPAAVADRLRRTAGISLVSEVRAGQWGLDGSTKTLLAVDPATVTRVHDVDPGATDAVRRLGPGGVLVRDTVAEHHGWRVGTEVPMTFARTGTRPMHIEATFSTTAVRTDYVISLSAFEANYAQQQDLEVDVLLAPGTTPAAGGAAIRRALADFPVVKVMDRAQALRAQQEQVDRLLVPVTALLALSVAIALLGIANTLTLSIQERGRELDLLRALGMARSQLRSMVRSEAVIVASLGTVLGVGLAVLFGWALVGAMRHLGVTHLVVPVGRLTALAAAASAAGLLAGALAAPRAAHLRVLTTNGSVGQV